MTARIFVFVALLLALGLCAAWGRAEAASSQLAAGGNLQSAVSGLGPGDTLTLSAGTFDCAGCLNNVPSGTPQAPVTIAGDPGGGTIIHLSGGGNGIDITSYSYVTFDHIDFDAGGVSSAGIKITCGSGGYGHHIRISNSSVHGAGTQGILANAGQCDANNQGFNEVTGSAIHNNGHDVQFDHGLYFCGSDNLIANNHIANNS